MPDNASFTYIDYSSEVSTTSINIPDVTDLNYAATEALLQTLSAEISGITIGSLRQRSMGIIVPTLLSPPADQQAQREKKWLVQYRATQTGQPDAGRYYNVEIPCADLSLLNEGSDILWKQPTVATGAVLDFITAFEAVAVSPAGSTVTCQAIRYVGRNS